MSSKKKSALIAILIISIGILLTNTITAQLKSNDELIQLILKYKKDARGPYKAIRWFCIDGTTVSPDQRCNEPGGVQRAQYKDEVTSLAKSNKIYLGQILAATNFEEFWDNKNHNSRTKQYIIEKYLRAIDDGWVLKKAKFYRGAFQAEDEQEWGLKFLTWLLSDESNLLDNFYFIRHSAKEIPHKGDNRNDQLIRAISKNLSDTIPSFMDLRVKIHGHPESNDIESVKKYRDVNKNKLTAGQLKQMDELISEMTKSFQPIDFAGFNKYIKQIGPNSIIKDDLSSFAAKFSKPELAENYGQKLSELSNLMLKIRQTITTEKSVKGKLALLDLTIIFEDILFREIDQWKTMNLKELLEKNYYIAQALVGTGHLELWEWEYIKEIMSVPTQEKVTAESFSLLTDYSKKIVEWSSSTVRACFEEEVTLFQNFEPIASGFFDDNIRSSLLLQYGNLVGRISAYNSSVSGLTNKVFDIADQNSIRGLNPGFALGELVVFKGSAEDVEFKADKIYVFERPPSDLKPVAGIATVSEGNLVSHIQLLARNLGIPNSIVSMQNLNELQKYAGQKVFYAVSRKGTVIIKPANKMSEQEKNLFVVKKTSSDIITVPVDKLRLDANKVINIKNVRSKDSGEICGPKAANLGQLKSLFPNNVVEGFVIPFGIFKNHMDQVIPGRSITYWTVLNEIFSKSRTMKNSGQSSEEIEIFVLGQLKELRNLIQSMPLKESFIKDLRENFISILGNSIGKVPVFLRSDTNMEDLKDFTGAGLNLTLFNVLEESKILEGIKEVWASPFSERSYRWRQKLLNNPENVFPSILVIPSVDVEKSGVMITTGVTTDDPADVTIAFSKGAGGAVEGQAAESYLLKSDGTNLLISPSREAKYNILPATGGTGKGYTTFNHSLLSNSDITQLRKMSEEIKKKLPGTPGIESKGPFDVELGFKDSKIWLFQVRPFVESKKAVSSSYLNSINPVSGKSKLINLSEPM